MRLFIGLLFVMLISCEDYSKEVNIVETDIDLPVIDSNISITEKQKDTIGSFVEIKSFPFKDSIHPVDKKLVRLNQQDWFNYGFDSLSTFIKQEDVIYGVEGYFTFNEQLFLLVEQHYVEESIHWLCAVDKDLHLIDHVMTAYENSEGFHACDAIINKQNALTLMVNAYEFNSEKVEQYLWDGSFTLVSSSN